MRASGGPPPYYVALDDEFGVALINGAQPPARRRCTLAHHVFQDEYTIDIAATGRAETERIIDAFATHLLLARHTRSSVARTGRRR